MNLPTDLVSDLKDGRLLLFAGSGVSAVLGLPSWSGLVSRMADELSFDSEIFQELGTYPTLAEYYWLVKNKDIDDLVKWMKSAWINPTIVIAKSAVHRSLANIKFPIIYTTNYDNWIEATLDHYGVPYSKIVTGEDIPRIVSGQTQIVKFHGDLEAPSTLVLTESDYFERLKFETELDIKLRSDLLRYSTLFIGYSLTDG
jgi:hypothetical protein